ncbi:hypothetical protein KCV07_g9837, partial [Aureobasidium melanogenum]
MKGFLSLLLIWVVTARAADSFVYTFDQRDVKPLKPQRAPIIEQPLRKREEPAGYQSHNHLFPAIHPHLDKRDVVHLHSRQEHSLFYTKDGGIQLQDADMVATLDATFHWDSVILDHSAYVKNVTCQQDQMLIKLDSVGSLTAAKTNWTGDTIVFVSSDKSCHITYPGQFGFFNTSLISYDQKTLTATAKGQQISVEQAIKEFNIVWGHWEAAGSPQTEQQVAPPVKIAAVSPSTSRSSTSSSSTSRPSSSSFYELECYKFPQVEYYKSACFNKIIIKYEEFERYSKIQHLKFTYIEQYNYAQYLQVCPSSVPANNTRSATPTSSLATNSTSRESFETLVPPTGTGKCGVVPSPMPSGISKYFSQVACDNEFDRHVDDFFTYLRDVANLNGALSRWAPNTGITSANIPEAGTSSVLTRRGIEKRGFGDFLSGVVKVLKFIVDVVIAVVKAVVTAVRNLAESLLPTWNPSASFTIPVALEPNSRLLDECPWGDGGFELWKWSPEDGGEAFDPLSFDTLAKMTGADQILTFKIDGVEQLPEPGVTVWCVDCGIHGSIYTTGSATFTIIGPTRLSLRLRGDLNANVQIGVDGFYQFERPILEIPLTPDIGLPGFSIPGVITIGPYLTVDLVAKIEVEAVGQILAGVNLDWPEMGMFVDFLLPGSAKSYGFSPIVTPVFKASGEITATASLGIPIGINLGVSVLDGIWEESLALVNTPAIQAVAEYSASYDNEEGVQLGGDECAGIYFYSNVVNSLELEVPLVGAFDLGKWEGPKFIEGCVNDNGVTTVRQQEQPAVGGKTRAGCDLVDNVFRNGAFDNGLSYWTPLMGFDNAEMGVRAEGTNGELSVHRETFDTGGCFIKTCAFGTCLASGECDGGCDSACPQPQGPWKFTVSQVVDLCTYSQYNAEVSGRVERGSDRTSCKVNKWFVEGADANSQWYKADIPFDRPILPKTSSNTDNLPIGLASSGGSQIAITIPAKDNAPSYKVKVGIEVECTSDDFDVRLDDFKLEPDPSAFMKRDLQAQRMMIVHPDLATFHDNATLQARQVPAIAADTTVPQVSAAGSMPAISVSQAAPAISSGNAIPTIAAANGVPALGKPQAAPVLSEGIPIIQVSNAVPAIESTQAAPVMPEGNAIPTIAAANAAPTLESTQAVPVIGAANAAPTLPPNLQAPSFDYVPGGNLAGGTYTLGAAVPTATAVFIGENKYKFPTFEDIMKSATVGVAGAVPTAGSGEPFTGWTTLSNLDTRQKSSLAAAEDGNFYMVGSTGGTSPGTQFYSENSIAFKDESERMFHYYPDTMSAYGVSRLRASQVLDTPLGAQLITLVPVSTPEGVVAYVAADTDGHNYLLAWCTAPRWQGSKVFLVSDYEKGLQTLLSGDVQWIVTGNNVTECDSLVLTSQAGGLTPV